MTREICLSLLTEVNDLLEVPVPDKSDSEYQALLKRYQECLSGLNFIVNVTSSVVDESERIILCSSYSIWTKCLDLLSGQCDCLNAFIVKGDEERTIEKSLVFFADEISIYRVRLIRGVIILCRNLCVGIERTLNSEGDDIKKLYISRGVRVNEIYEVNQKIQLLYSSHDKCFSTLIAAYVEIIACAEVYHYDDPDHVHGTMEEEKYLYIRDFYIKSIASLYECMSNISGLDKFLADERAQLRIDTPPEEKMKKAKYLDINNLNEVIIQPVKIDSSDKRTKFEGRSYINVKGQNMFTLKKVEIISKNPSILKPFLQYYDHIAKDRESSHYDFDTQMEDFLDALYLFCLVTRDSLDNFENLEDDDIKRLLLDIMSHNITKHDYILSIKATLSHTYGDLDQLQEDRQEKRHTQFEYQRDVESLRMIFRFLQIYTISNYNGFLDSEQNAILLTNYTLDLLNIISGLTIKMIEKPNSQFENDDIWKFKSFFSYCMSLLDGISFLLPYNCARELINGSLDLFLDLLKVCEINTTKSKLKDNKNLNMENGSEVAKKEVLLLDDVKNASLKQLPFIKSLLIEIITGLVYENFKNQEMVRDKQCIEIILNNCNLDDNEPFIKERCILCLKYLLAKNPKNQEFISQLEAKRINLDEENEEMLAKSGYEVDIIEGKIKLKKAEKIEELERGLKDEKAH